MESSVIKVIKKFNSHNPFLRELLEEMATLIHEGVTPKR